MCRSDSSKKSKKIKVKSLRDLNRRLCSKLLSWLPPQIEKPIISRFKSWELRSNFLNYVQYSQSCKIMLPKDIRNHYRHAQKSWDKAIVARTAEKINVE
jgi:hypothetical protein